MPINRTLDDTVNRTSLDLKRAQEDLLSKKGRITELEALLSGLYALRFFIRRASADAGTRDLVS